jgi:hypothetical protein
MPATRKDLIPRPHSAHVTAVACGAVAFVETLLQRSPSARPSAEAALAHEWLSRAYNHKRRSGDHTAAAADAVATAAAEGGERGEGGGGEDSEGDGGGGGGGPVIPAEVLSSLRSYHNVAVVKKLAMQLIAVRMSPNQLDALRKSVVFTTTRHIRSCRAHGAIRRL